MTDLEIKTKLVDKIKSMSAKEIILAMVESLRSPVVNINMECWGSKTSAGICYGCAATNTICKIGEFDPKSVLYSGGSIYSNKNDYDPITIFIRKFEYAINDLRQGDINGYNLMAKVAGFADIPEIHRYYTSLPILTDYYTEEDLKEYENFANTL